MSNYQVIKVAGREHVICSTNRDIVKFNLPDANYQGTGMALCGILDKGETLEDWMKKNHKPLTR